MAGKVSVITPSFNQGELIEITILSVIRQRQSYSNLEHIVIDGESSDRTIEILEKYSGEVIWVSEPDRGFADAVNKGLAIATGEVIGIQSADDLYSVGAVQRAMEIMSQHPEVDLVYGYFHAIDEHDQIVRLGRPLPPFSLDGYLALDFVIPQAAVFFRKAVVPSVGNLDSEIDYVADMEFWLRVAAKHRLLSVPECFSYVRFHDEARNLTSMRFGKDWVTALRKNFNTGYLDVGATARKRALAGASVYGSFYELSNGTLGGFVKEVARALKTYPTWVLRRRAGRLARAVIRRMIPRPVKAFVRRRRIRRLNLEKAVY